MSVDAPVCRRAPLSTRPDLKRYQATLHPILQGRNVTIWWWQTFAHPASHDGRAAAAASPYADGRAEQYAIARYHSLIRHASSNVLAQPRGRLIESCLAELRAEAVNRKLDMTDAFEEYAGSGYEKNMGVMDKNRFRSTMGTLFMGSVSAELLRAICYHWRAGHPDPDPNEGPNAYSQVRWKQFAIDFDNVPLPADYGDLPPLEADLESALKVMRAAAMNKRLDMTDAFEEYSGTLQEKNTGIMAKNRFRATMGVLFQGNLSNDVLLRICQRYAAGPADPREPGTGMQVQWKRFAIDFDELAPVEPPPLPDPTPEILEAMRVMNRYCNLYAIDLAWDFEEYLGGKDKCSSDLVPREKFRQALGVLLGRATSLYRHDDAMLDKICDCYAGGARMARDPRLFEQVQWREFCLDVNRIQPQPYLQTLQGPSGTWDDGVMVYPQVGTMGEENPDIFSPIGPTHGYGDSSAGNVSFNLPAGHAPARKTMVQRVVKATTGPSPTTGAAAASTRATNRTARSTARSVGGDAAGTGRAAGM